MDKKILATGFDRFGYDKKPNPSSEIVLPALNREYPDIIETRILPTVFGEASRDVEQFVEEINPVAVVMFGMAPGRFIRIERFARNWRSNVLVPDNRGKRGIGLINIEGPAMLSSTLPAKDLHATLKNSIDTRPVLSVNAGSFVCNATMYEVLRSTQNAHIPIGFIHIGNNLETPTIERAAVAIVNAIAHLVV